MSEHQLGDAPVSDKHRRMMNVLAGVLDAAFNGEARGKDKKNGFVLLVYPFTGEGTGTDGRCNFISNGADRKDIVVLFKEMIARFEGQPELSGKA